MIWSRVPFGSEDHHCVRAGRRGRGRVEEPLSQRAAVRRATGSDRRWIEIAPCGAERQAPAHAFRSGACAAAFFSGGLTRS